MKEEVDSNKPHDGPEEDMSERKYDAVIVFPFGENIRSSTNKSLVQRAAREARDLGVTLIMNESMSELYGKRSFRVTVFKGDTVCKYAQNIKEDMAREIWKNVLVIAATPILERCIRDLQRVYPGNVAFHECKELRRDTPYSLWFWEKGDLFEKVRAGAYYIYEQALRLVPWPIYRWFSLWVW